jgi:hypothetical protein
MKACEELGKKMSANEGLQQTPQSVGDSKSGGEKSSFPVSRGAAEPWCWGASKQEE